MSIRFICSSCQSKVTAPDEAAGRTANCPKCGARVKVPGPATPERTERDAPAKTGVSRFPGKPETLTTAGPTTPPRKNMPVPQVERQRGAIPSLALPSTPGDWFRNNYWKLISLAVVVVAGIVVTVVFLSLRGQGSSSARTSVASSSSHDEGDRVAAKGQSSASTSVASSPSTYDASSSTSAASSSNSTVASSSKPKADGRTEEQTKAAKEFKFEGVSFSTTLEEFKTAHPDAELQAEDSDKKIRLEVYLADSEAASILMVKFFDGQLMEMRILYDVKKVNKIGGWEVLLERLVDKFGKADADSLGYDKEEKKAQLDWTFKKANKVVTFLAVERKNHFRVDVEDTEIAKKMRDAKAKSADTGFDK
jgi:hypothetical protein